MNLEQAKAWAKQNIHNRPQTQGRLAGKLAIVTGAAQGFGLGIAQEMIAQGAMKEADPRQLAIAFYGPMTLLTGLYDAGESAQTLTRQLERHIDDFFARHATAQRP